MAKQTSKHRTIQSKRRRSKKGGPRDINVKHGRIVAEQGLTIVSAEHYTDRTATTFPVPASVVRVFDALRRKGVTRSAAIDITVAKLLTMQRAPKPRFRRTKPGQDAFISARLSARTFRDLDKAAKQHGFETRREALEACADLVVAGQVR